MSVITFSKDKRAISIMIGYILLITGAVVMGAIVFQWMKTYVPKDAIDCPDGVSLFISQSDCTEFTNNYQLRLTTKNNGRFDIGGYFIHATNSSGQDLATIDLSESLIAGGENLSQAVIFQGWYNNFLQPGNDIPSIFNVSSEIYTIELIPVRFQVHDNKKRIVSCSAAKIIENVNCEPYVAGGATCTDTCDNLGYDCDSHTICGSSVNCGTCSTGSCVAGSCEAPGCTLDSECDTTINEVCVSGSCTLCGNGDVDTGDGEECDSVVGCGDDCLAEVGYDCEPAINICAN